MFNVAQGTNQIKQFLQIPYGCGELSNKHFCKNKILLSPISNLHFSHYKSMETINCHSRKSSYPTGIKNITFVEGNVLNKYAKFKLHPLYSF